MINGHGVILKSNGPGAIFQLGRNATLNDITFRDAANVHPGLGALFASAFNNNLITLNNCHFINNSNLALHSQGSGAAIQHSRGRLHLNNCSFINNLSSGISSAISSIVEPSAQPTAELHISQCTFSGNSGPYAILTSGDVRVRLLSPIQQDIFIQPSSEGVEFAHLFEATVGSSFGIFGFF